ncbi:MAG: trehalase family glycosidase [Chloroflexota bacterium]
MDRLHNRIDLTHIPYTERGSRLLVFRKADELNIRLAERWTKREKEFGHYRQRQPLVDHFTLLDGSGNPLHFEVDSYPYVVRLLTAEGTFALTFFDPETLLLRLPKGRFGFAFSVQADQGEADRRGGILKGMRSVIYTANAHLVSNQIERIENGHFQVRIMVESQDGDALLLNITPRLGFNRSIPPADAAIETVRQQWQAWFDAAPPVLDAYRSQYEYAWWMMRSGLLNQRFYFTREALVPSKIHYVGVWHWDQFFHAIAFRHVDTRLAEDQLRIVLDHQRPNGMLPDAIFDEGTVTHLTLPVDEDVTKPPLAAWTALKLYEKSGHLDFLEEIYQPLVRWNSWWMTESVNANHLAEYRHPFSSGLDDSPLWDDGMPVVAPDLNTYLCIQQESLARIADLIGLPAEAEQFRRDADQLAQLMLEHLWSEEEGLFWATHLGKPVNTITPFNLLPIWTARLPSAVTERLIQRLTDPAHFWPQWPIPTVSVSDPKFDPMQMWRGPTWTNINYLFVEALTRNGMHDLARQLRQKTLALVMEHQDIYEYYNPLTGERPPKSAPMYGWSAATFIDLAIQESNAVWLETGQTAARHNGDIGNK